MSLLPSHQYAITHHIITDDTAQHTVSCCMHDWLQKIEHQQQASWAKRMMRTLASWWPSFLAKPPRISALTAKPPTGFYVYGVSGTGKTMLMHYANNDFQHLRINRVHFHDFMHNTHQMLNLYRQNNNTNDPIDTIARDYKKHYTIIAFDEFLVENIADAMILARVIERLNFYNIYIMATSNFAPNMLYSHGLQRDLFTPFIDYVQKNWIIAFMDSHHDYRLSYKDHNNGHYYIKRPDILWAIFCESATKESIYSCKLLLGSNRFMVLEHCLNTSTYIHYNQLFDTEVSAHDYSILCQKFNTIYVHNIPIFTDDTRNALKRFIHFIDVIHDSSCQLFISAEVDITSLFATKAFKTEVKRCISRLHHL